MSDFVEVKTAELTGPALDWAVASATGEVLSGESIQAVHILVGAGVDGDLQRKFSPSTDWAVGGLLWDEWATSMEHYDGWCVAVVGGDAQGPTKLIALCRAIVAAKLGDVVQVPTALIGGAA